MNQQDDRSIDVSICIVTFQACELLRACLKSIYQNTAICFEVIVIDNSSRDGVGQMLSIDYPDVQYIQNPTNLGFTHPMNQGLQIGQGRYLLLLNPDTQVLPQAIDNLVSFMEIHPEAGVCGPKVLNKDLTLQKPCRRGESTPWAVITYFTGLSALFPRSRLFSQYLMTYKDENFPHLVDGVAGSCMMVRRAVIEQIGYLDERFFAYQEDADYCYRARQVGWKVYYVPQAMIMHYGGMGGSRVEPYRSIYEWHRSYFFYYNKNLAKNYFFLINWLYYLAMLLKFILTMGINLFRRNKLIAGSNYQP
jgi:GT2 family glycosyltransferase